MIRALALKELREILPFAIMALAAGLILVASLTGVPLFAQILGEFMRQSIATPFLDAGFLKGLWLIAGVLAIALGFRQSAPENAHGTYQFLLHRPICRDLIFLTKLGIGWATFLVCTGVPIVVYAIWAAIPGTHPSPFEWSMTSSCWQACLILSLLYGGAFLSGLRPARWLGTRLLPLAAGLVPVIVMLILPWSWLWGLPLLLAFYVILAINICFVARTREYS